MNIPSAERRGAFTLIELLCVIAIIALLATLTIPTVGTFIEKARQVKCAQNLRQIFVFTSSAATDNENRFPKIEIDKDSPAYGGDATARSLFDTLKPYGCTEKTLQCPSDTTGPNWYAKKDTSYMWQPYSEDEPTNAITVYTPRGAFPAKLSRVRLCQDWDVVHAPEEVGMRKRMNVLYADGHVTLR
jgi:prepilin-type N-terminal cleavage/methylation domain-containing protein/prepilin-type processing-associated H-X9-DG protein